MKLLITCTPIVAYTHPVNRGHGSYGTIQKQFEKWSLSKDSRYAGISREKGDDGVF
jgi:hypothetical protein